MIDFGCGRKLEINDKDQQFFSENVPATTLPRECPLSENYELLPKT